MRRVSVVIGANYGDEGKGVITDALACRSPESIVVMTNGGAQRGHTVICPKTGKPHVFHHFGSGTFRGCMTYFPETYILNPMQFVKEYHELSNDFAVSPVRSVRHRYCLFSTPFDMILNQDIEKWRKAHGTPCGTCGMGIWETLVRTSNSVVHGLYKHLGHFNSVSHERKVKWLKGIRDKYCRRRYRKITGEEWKPAPYVLSYGLIEHFIQDVDFMCAVCPEEHSGYETIANHNGNVIFENGQGLMLDDEYSGSEFSMLNTPSQTGMHNVNIILGAIDKSFGIRPISVDAYYVSRPYVTRHGPGEVITSRKGEVFFSDSTNGTNEFQGAFRQMPIDHARQIAVIQRDMDTYLAPINADSKSATLAFTHVDQMSPGKVDFPSIAECGTSKGAEDFKGLKW